MRAFDVRMLAIQCVLLMAGSSVAQAPSYSDEYEMHWRAATHALVAFSISEMVANEGSSGSRARPAKEYRREHDNFARELRWISQSKPEPRQFLRHWKLVPIYEEALSAMTIIADAVDSSQSGAAAAGWASFRDALTHLRGTIEEITRADE